MSALDDSKADSALWAIGSGSPSRPKQNDDMCHRDSFRPFATRPMWSATSRTTTRPMTPAERDPADEVIRRGERAAAVQPPRMADIGQQRSECWAKQKAAKKEPSLQSAGLISLVWSCQNYPRRSASAVDEAA